MKTTTQALLAAILAVTPAYASAGEAAGSGILMTAFLGFVALIIAFQLVPALTLFFAMMKGLFSAVTSKPAGLEVGARERKP